MLSRPSSLITAGVVWLVGARPDRASGDPLYEESTTAGFAVTRAVRPEVLSLEGRHRFSRYALTFRLRDAHAPATATIVTAESRAVFPGVAGKAYRALVVGTGGHVVAVRRMLARIAGEVAGYEVIARRDVGGSPSSR